MPVKEAVDIPDAMDDKCHTDKADNPADHQQQDEVDLAVHHTFHAGINLFRKLCYQLLHSRSRGI